MTDHKFFVSGMTCMACVNSIKNALTIQYPDSKVNLSLKTSELTISSVEEIFLDKINKLVSELGSYSITNENPANTVNFVTFKTKYKKSLFSRIYNYFNDKRPILFALIIISISSLALASNFNEESLLRSFTTFYMGMFFTVFSFLKLINISGFAKNFAEYDFISKRIFKYALIYPFIELILGMYFLSGNSNIFIYPLIVIIMISQTFGVAKAVFQKQNIKCACMGDGINLSISGVTLFENLVMICMSIYMIIVVL
ncbi:MAG: heavy-metal-associated domain-containing protein [Dehalococcoidia bacterium]